MKTIFAAAAMLLMAQSVHAQALFYTAISSAVVSEVTVSTYQATQIDNLNIGVAQTLDARTDIVVTLPSGKMNCGFDNLVSTVTSPTPSVHLGSEFDSGIQYVIPLAARLKLWCIMQAQSAAQAISVVQRSAFLTPRFKGQ